MTEGIYTDCVVMSMRIEGEKLHTDCIRYVGMITNSTRKLFFRDINIPSLTLLVYASF